MAQNMAEASGPQHCWGPLGTPWPWLHGAPAVMAVLLCPSKAAAEGSLSAQAGTVMEGNGPTQLRCSARLSQRIN